MGLNRGYGSGSRQPQFAGPTYGASQPSTDLSWMSTIGTRSGPSIDDMMAPAFAMQAAQHQQADAMQWAALGPEGRARASASAMELVDKAVPSYSTYRSFFEAHAKSQGASTPAGRARLVKMMEQAGFHMPPEPGPLDALASEVHAQEFYASLPWADDATKQRARDLRRQGDAVGIDSGQRGANAPAFNPGDILHGVGDFLGGLFDFSDWL